MNNPPLLPLSKSLCEVNIYVLQAIKKKKNYKFTPDFRLTFFIAGGLENVLQGNQPRNSPCRDCTWHELAFYVFETKKLSYEHCVNLMPPC